VESSESDLLRLTLIAHDAAVDSSLWPTFLEGVARETGADLSMIQRHYLAHHRSETVVTFGMTPRLRADYNAYYSRVNVWREHGRHLFVAGRVIADAEACPVSLLKRSEFYNDCLLPNDLTHSLAGVVACGRDEALMLTVMRRDRRRDWEESDRRVLGVLVPHMARAQQAQERLRMLEAGEAAINLLQIGTLLLGTDGTVVFQNHAAERAVVHARDGLVLRNGRIGAVDRDADAALRRLITCALAVDRSLGVAPDVLVPRPSQRRPYLVTASPLRQSLGPFIGMMRPVALVLVTDPELRSPVAAETLRQGYKLTPKEATLALALADGHTLERAAERLGIRYETARTHLRRILSKTQTSRQAELAALIERVSR
jgi:DNA-binding CsgD family transcriptional regulator